MPRGDPHRAAGSEPGPGPEVVGDDRTASGFAGLAELVELARSTLLAEGVGRGRLDLLVVDRAEMADLNEAHMGQRGPTDVLAFPIDADEVLAAGAGPGAGPPIHLGDVILCPDRAREQAADHTGSTEAELTLLVVHGVLHVLGHDHGEPGERALMQARERHHLALAGFEHPADRGVGGRR